MGLRSLSAVAWVSLAAACGGSAFSASGGGGEGGSSSGSAGGSGTEQGASGSTGGSVGAGGTGIVMVDASVNGGSGGQSAVDASPKSDVSMGSGGVPVLEAGPPEASAPPFCPVTEPALGGACSGSLKCTYGTHPRIACRKMYVCTVGQWAQAATTACEDLKACTAENPLPHIGGACPTAGHDCVWDSGLYCRCLACPDVGCPNWNCFPPPNNCATTPANLGQACKADATATACDYGNCSLGTRVTVSCVGGMINWTFPNCQ
jgi:hypothetical protein